MPETLILHLGLHKTATTALQDFLAGETGRSSRTASPTRGWRGCART